jgi:hypothetical protein
MKIYGMIVKDKFVYSRARHDFRTYEGYSIDGGQPCSASCVRTLYKEKPPIMTWVEVKNLTLADLINDWNMKKDKLGICDLKDVRILSKEDWPDTDSLQWEEENMVWGHYILPNSIESGYYEYKMMWRLSTPHLKAILKTQKQISEECENYIKKLLKLREVIFL